MEGFNIRFKRSGELKRFLILLFLQTLGASGNEKIKDCEFPAHEAGNFIIISTFNNNNFVQALKEAIHKSPKGPSKGFFCTRYKYNGIKLSA